MTQYARASYAIAARTRSTVLHHAVSGLLSAAAMVSSTGLPAHAEPVTDRILAGHQVVTQAGCVLVKINFNVRMRYASHFPQDQGSDLRIVVRPIDPAQTAAAIVTRRESLRPPEGVATHIKSIEFEAARADSPVVNIQFDTPVVYKVAGGADFQSIIVAIASGKSRSACAPVLPAQAADGWNTTLSRGGESRRGQDAPSVARVEPLQATRTEAAAPKQGSAADERAAGAAMDEGRAALKKADYAKAIGLLRKATQMPQTSHSGSALELLGVAYQKNKQPVEAKAQFEDYLRRFPAGEGSEAVRQRLDAILTAELPAGDRLHAARRQADRGPGQTTWTLSGSASQFYVRDDSFRVVRDPTLPLDLNADKEDHRVHRNVLMSNLDLFAAWGNNDVKSKFRFSGAEEHSFVSGQRELASVSALYLETSVRDWGTTSRIGRQNRNAGGVLGRFDGALVTWQSSPWMRINVVGGSPVISRRDEPFKDEKYFYGTSVDFGPFFGGIEASLFAIEQRARDLVDRQALGTELRYLDATKSAFFTLDYDTHFNQLNAAIFSGSWTLPDKSVLHGGADYRKAPYLTSWNALQGQSYATLYQLLKVRTKEEIDQMAVDRTASYKSATIGYSRPLTDKLQFNVDATAANISGTIPSFGVDATPSTGDEFYYSAQLVGTSLLTSGDLYTLGIRYANRQDSDTYAIDVSTRYPVTDKLRVNPRLLLSYRTGNTIELKEYAILPSVLLNYAVMKDLNLELEVGAKWTTRQEAMGVKSNDTDFFVTAGFRYDFYADGKGKCPSPTAQCR
jgi:tetratricopeptide (TPR) repeat protein